MGNQAGRKSWRDMGGKQVCVCGVLPSLALHVPACCRLQFPNSTCCVPLGFGPKFPLLGGLPGSHLPVCSLSSRSLAMCWLFCTAFLVGSEGAFSGQPHRAQAVTGWPFLPELLPAVQEQKAAVSPQLLAEQCQR